MGDLILKMINITKEFYGVKALDNVCLEVKKGEIHGLCGENGAGKSTLMKILSGVYPYGTYTGEIIYNDKQLKLNNVNDSKKKGISIIHQELQLIKELSICENIFLGNEPNKNGIVDFNLMYKKTEELLEELKMDINPFTLVKNLGLGQQQLIEIAKALSQNANLLILDEPTASLTDNEVETLMKILRDLKARGVTCIYISHKLNEVLELCDRVTIIRDGKTIGTEETKNLNQDKIINMMVGREIKDLYPKEEHETGNEFFAVKKFSVYDNNNKNKKIVDNISFTLKKGEILGIAGLVGSGRTELVSSICGFYKGRKEGEIYINNNKVYIRNPIDALNLGIAMVPEDRKKDGIIGSMSVKENISISNINKYKQMLGIINESLELVDVNKYVKEFNIKAANLELKIKNLSGGNQQKAILARFLLRKPNILILDEPTRGIDVSAKYEIYKLINKLVKQGVSIILISSELPEILGMSDRIIVMHEGKLKGEFNNKNLTQEMIMECAIGGK
ncbi:xylose ABC transporter ATP-binding protein [Caloramator sp. CAR-1]|uniref:xylose ABC transporter ATP-binding protein n=1 Tax=Caloramator sp. CAR-1 TaxID=3062777 RepID=UPI0026E16459|nr:xylose ABC transporter ATP-binding protein [Caloramator sp. CAR-1]MDO6354729.1 xylose ABC transporter ATP-binding protein [Caloramator sp. CAR-1]